MGKQVNFLLMPDDLAALEAKLRARISFEVILHRNARPIPVRTRLQPWTVGVDSFRVHLVRDEDFSKVQYWHRKAWGDYVVDSLRSPVIDFDRCTLSKGVLHPGRIYFVEGYYDSNNAWTTKDEGFIRWARKIQRTTWRFLEGQKINSFLFCGPSALAAQESGIELAEI